MNARMSPVTTNVFPSLSLKGMGVMRMENYDSLWTNAIDWNTCIRTTTKNGFPVLSLKEAGVDMGKEDSLLKSARDRNTHIPMTPRVVFPSLALKEGDLGSRQVEKCWTKKAN
jgi:hypothetical protein